MAMPTVLYVDDEPIFVAQIAKWLGPHYHVLVADTVHDALDIIRSSHRIDLLLTDLLMPSERGGPLEITGGLDLIEAARKDRRIPVIVLSGYLDGLTKQLTLLGVRAHIAKTSVSPDALLQLIGQALSDGRRGSSLDSGLSLADIQRAFAVEIERLIATKQRTLLLPDEQSFELIKPLIGFKRDIEDQIKRFPFEENVFLMMKFREHNRSLSDFIIETLAANGFRGVRADDRAWDITANTYNPLAVLYCCKYGIALFDEADPSQAYSPNVAYELGIMHAQGKNCLILRHSSLPALPFDLTKDIHQTYNRDLDVRSRVVEWTAQMSARENARPNRPVS
jgi:CheY-like chemotaxis protein